ncbi:MAG TPA: YsnF/AvaK domain-containing protein [Bryobacteraceae bacterium]|jgi:uncharacterized protein (TIGR02271 family)|nr:YsnF/AvaK domain-containing protein [Bryobacteraceae bacterium]
MPRTTDNTIIAVFKSSADAQAAEADLKAAGIADEDIHLESGNRTGTSSHSGTHERGITGWFKSLFSDNDDADRSQYENALTQGNYLLRVDADEDEISTVENILNRHSPVDVHADSGNTRMGQPATRTSGAAATAAGATARGTGTADAETRAVPVVEEELQVGKRRVLRGGVRVYSRVVEEPVEENVRLREERVRVDRQRVNRAAGEADLRAGQEQVIEVEEFAEEPVVAKQARVVEEVRVGKDVSERTETIRDTVRHTEVDVQKTNGSTAGSYDDSDFHSDFQQRYGATGGDYETYLPAYRYGYDMASNPQYRGRSFDDVESDLRTDYGRRYPNSAWDRMKDAIRHGWNKVTGKTEAATR